MGIVATRNVAIVMNTVAMTTVEAETGVDDIYNQQLFVLFIYYFSDHLHSMTMTTT